MVSKVPDAFVFMKVGNHAGETFEQILERKRRELSAAGRIFWGYGGTACHPLTQVQPFARYHLRTQGSVHLLMEQIDSRAEPDLLPAKEYSKDGVNWMPLPSGVTVTGSRYALVLGEIRPGDLEVQTQRYIVGVGPSRGKLGSEYLKGRIDKGCLELASSESGASDSPVRRVTLVAELKDPFGVILR